MDVIHTRCCGLDIHKRSVVACVLISDTEGEPTRSTRTFGTMTADLLALSDWLAEQRVTHVAMESTAVYWKPVWNLLEGSFELLLVNAHHIKAVPGRKTDVADAEWIASLLRHGLLRSSYVPDRAQRELRELTRYRTSLVRERTAEANRLQATLEGANVKLASVATDILGKSGREKIPQLERALAGCFGPHQRFLIAQQLAHIDFLEEAIARLSEEVAERLRPLDGRIEQLDSIPGVGRYMAEALLAEIGADMSRFPTAGHLASWAGMCPGSHESAGKRRSGRTRKGNPWLRVLLVQAAHAAARTKGTYLGAQYRRLAARRGKSRAAVAVGHSILVIIYHLLRDGTLYQDLGPSYFDERDRQATQRRLVRRLEGLGYKVTLEPTAA